MARDTWYRLDNVGTFYASEAGNSLQTVFRLSAAMEGEVDPDLLQRALDRTIARYPSFNVCLRSGLFWHYLEPAETAPQVHPESMPICFGLHAGPKSVLFRVSFYRERVNLEVSHMISDGRGSLSFFKRLISEYAAARYGTPLPPDDGEMNCEEEGEDGFRKHYQRKKAASTPTRRAYRIRGLREPGETTYLEYHLPASKVHALARACDASVTSFIIAAVICAIRDRRPPWDTTKPIRLTVPVDLRQFFESATTRNFFGLVTVVYGPHGNERIEEVAFKVQRQIREAARPEQLEKRMNQMISLERNPFLRCAPLFLKDLVLDLASRIAARDITSAVSSLGRISFDDAVNEHVRGVSLLTSTYDLNFIICTFGDDLSIGISTVFTDLGIVRDLCRSFSARGIHGHLNINKGREGVERDLRSAQLQENVRQMVEGGGRR